MTQLITSRTAVLTYQDCPRKRYLQFHAKGSGISGTKLNLDIFIGTIFHRGMQNLLEHARVEHSGDTRLIKRSCINESIEVARTLFWKMLEESNGLASKKDDYTPYEYKVEEAWALCEALIRGYAIWRLPTFGEQFEVLEVENEEIYPLADSIIFQAKADGLLRSRYNNELYVLSYKTAKDFPDVTMRNILHDMQGMSEIAAINYRLNKGYQLYLNPQTPNKVLESQFSKAIIIHFMKCKTLQLKEINCHAVQYEYALKGKYNQDPYNSGMYKWQTPFLHPWKNEGVQNIFSGKTRGMDYKWKPGKGRQPKEWEKIDIWAENQVGVEAWLDMLITGQIQPEEGNPFQWYFISPDAVIRSAEEIEEWRISTSVQEQTILSSLRYVENFEGEDYNVKLAKGFPKHTNRCHDYYGHDCPFVPICHENQTVDGMLDSGVMSTRQPHHALELETFKKEGFLK